MIFAAYMTCMQVGQFGYIYYANFLWNNAIHLLFSSLVCHHLVDCFHLSPFFFTLFMTNITIEPNTYWAHLLICEAMHSWWLCRLPRLTSDICAPSALAKTLHSFKNRELNGATKSQWSADCEIGCHNMQLLSPDPTWKAESHITMRGVMTQEACAWMWDSEPHVTLAGTKKCHLPDYLHDYRGAHEILKKLSLLPVSVFLWDEGRGELCFCSTCPAWGTHAFKGSRTAQFPWCFAADNRLPLKAGRRFSPALMHRQFN